MTVNKSYNRNISKAEMAAMMVQRYCIFCKGKISYLTSGGNPVAPRNYVKKDYCREPDCVSSQKRTKVRKVSSIPYEFKGIDYFTLGRQSEMIKGERYE